MKNTSIFSIALGVAFIVFSACGANDTQLDPVANEVLNAQEFASTDMIYETVDELPAPTEGFQVYFQSIASKLKYPEDAKKQGIEGKVAIEFIVTKEGAITNVKVLKGLHPSCDQAAARVVAQSTAWNPGVKDGKVVNTKLVLPISFKLDEDI